MNDSVESLRELRDFHPLSETGHEVLDYVLGIEANPIESAIDCTLKAGCERAKQTGDGQGAGGRSHRRLISPADHLRQGNRDGGVHQSENPGYQRTADCAANQPVDLIEPRLEDGCSVAKKEQSDGQCGEGDRLSTKVIGYDFRYEP